MKISNLKLLDCNNNPMIIELQNDNSINISANFNIRNVGELDLIHNYIKSMLESTKKYITPVKNDSKDILNGYVNFPAGSYDFLIDGIRFKIVERKEYPSYKTVFPNRFWIIENIDSIPIDSIKHINTHIFIKKIKTKTMLVDYLNSEKFKQKVLNIKKIYENTKNG